MPRSHPNLLLRSGWGFPAQAMRPLADALAAAFPATSRLADAFATSPVGAPEIEVGWSLGGLVALQRAARGESSPRALVLLCATARFCDGDAYPHGQPAARVRSMLRGLRTDPARTARDFYARCASPAAAPLDLQRQLADGLSLGADELQRGLQLLLAADLRAEIAAVRCPALLLHGECDVIIPPGASAWLAEHLPTARLHIRPGLGHDLPLRDTDWVAHQIRDFVGSLP